MRSSRLGGVARLFWSILANEPEITRMTLARSQMDSPVNTASTSDLAVSAEAGEPTVAEGVAVLRPEVEQPLPDKHDQV